MMKKRNSKSQKIALFIILSAFVIFLIHGFWLLSQEEKLLKSERQETVAKVTEVYSSSRGRWVKFEFYVGGKTFSNSMKYLNIYGALEPGDKFKIVYAESDPSVNRVLRNEDKSLIMISR